MLLGDQDIANCFKNLNEVLMRCIGILSILIGVVPVEEISKGKNAFNYILNLKVSLTERHLRIKKAEWRRKYTVN
jgi:hypothetical protein